MTSVSRWKMSKIIILIVGFISLVQAAPSAEPCVIILPPPRPAETVTTAPTTPVVPVAPVVTTSAPVAPVAPVTSAPAPAGPPALTPEQLATLIALYNMYMEYQRTQPAGGSALPPPPPAP